MKILIVEDKPKVAFFIKKGLEERNYEAEIVHDGLSAEKLAQHCKYNLFILYIIIPGIVGLELCRKFKKLNSNIPVLMLSALGTTDDKIIGFDDGTDDYLVKPFEFRELLCRVKVLIKKPSHSHDSFDNLIVNDLELDMDKKVARRGNSCIDLTAKEFSLLESCGMQKEMGAFVKLHICDNITHLLPGISTLNIVSLMFTIWLTWLKFEKCFPKE